MSDHKHLPNLDPLRFFAAAIVSFYHTDMILVANNYKKDYYYFFPFQHGDIAVVFFFVLSGFLITFLLLKEKETTNNIAVKKFYLKRIFRIWPLYFLMILLVFAYFNYSSYFHIGAVTPPFSLGNHWIINIAFLLLIAPNLVLQNVITLVYGNPTWSIGVEEQFYLIWPWVIKSKNSVKYICYIILSVFLLSNGLVSRLLSTLVNHHLILNNTLPYTVMFYFDKLFTSGYSLRIDAMAIGAVGSYLVFYKSPLLKVFYSKSFQVFIYLILLVLMLFQHVVAYQFYAIIFALIIINVATNAGTLINIKSKILSYLGKISYGIYMFHLIAILPVIKLVIGVFQCHLNFYSEILICLLSLMATILIAVISFNNFEKVFMKFKDILIERCQ